MIIQTDSGTYDVDESNIHTITVSTSFSTYNYEAAHRATLRIMQQQAAPLTKNLNYLGELTTEDFTHIVTRVIYAKPNTYKELP